MSSAIACHLVSQGPFMSGILGESQITYIVERRTHKGVGACILSEFREDAMDESHLSAEAKGVGRLMQSLKHGHYASPSARLSLEMVREDALADFPSVSLRSKFVFPGPSTVSEICVLDM